MDHDEVEPAAIDNHVLLTHNHGGSNGRWACRLLRRGCDLARKASLAVAAATAAPVVVPPLIVLSAAGVALSVPFAAYLASLAATDYLTRALLRACQPPSQSYHYHHQEYDDGVEQEFLDASEAYFHDAPPFGHFSAETARGEEDESDSTLLLPRHPGFSEASSATDAGEKEAGGEFSAREFGQDSYASNCADDTEEHTPVEKSETLFSDEDSQVQKTGEGEFCVTDPGKQPLQTENWIEKAGGLYSKYREEDGRSTEESKSTEETLSQGFNFPEPGGDDGNVVQEKGGAFFVQNSGQQSFQSKNWNEKEREDSKTREENISNEEMLSQGFNFPELHVPASSDKDNTVQEKGEGEFSAHDLGQYPLILNTEDKNEEGITMEENKSTEVMPLRDFVVSKSAVPVLHGEDDAVQSKEGFDVAVQELLEEANSNTDLVMGEVADVQLEITAIAAPESEVLPPSNLAACESPVDLVTGEVVDVDVGMAAAVEPESEVLHQTSESPAYPVTRESVDVQAEIISVAAPESEVLPPSNLVARESPPDVATKKMVSESFYFPASGVPASGGGDNVVQKKGEGELSVQSSGQQSFQSKNWNEKEEDDGRTTEENKSTEETVSQVFYFPESHVPASGDKGNVVRQKGEGEFSAHNLAPYSLPLNTRDEKEKDITMEEKKPTEGMPPRDLAVSESSVLVFRGEDDVVQSKEGFEVTVQGVVEEADSNTDLHMGEVDNVQVEIIAIAAPESETLPSSRMDLVTGEIVDVYAVIAAAVEPETESEVLHPSNLTTSESSADPETREIVDVQVDIVDAAVPESEVLPLSSLAALESQAIAETAHVGEVKNEKSMAIEEKKSTEDMPPRDSLVSESSVPVLGGEDDVAQSKEGFEVAVQELMEEANSNTDLVKGEVADVQVEVIAIAAPESEVLPPGNFAAHDSPADPVAGEIVRVQVNIVAAAPTGSEMLHPSDLATSDTPADSVTGEIVNVQVDVAAAAAAALGSEVLPLSSLAVCESQAVAETEHVGEIIGITVVEDIVRDFDDVNKGVSFIPVASVHDGEDIMSSGSTPYLSTVEEEMSDQPNQSTGVGYAVKNEAFGSRVAAGGEAGYTEEELREQLDALRTITGYGAVPSPTLEGELAGLYIFVGVEPAVGSSDTSDHLMELNAKLRFLKSIIGVD
ncbi:hypothetical protein ACQ4PT_070840 [Festuca glaucescens]